MAQQPSTESRDRVRGTVPKLIDLSEKVLFGDVWERPQLSKRDRSLIVCATLIATYRPEQLRGHLQRALANGAFSPTARTSAIVPAWIHCRVLPSTTRSI